MDVAILTKEQIEQQVNELVGKYRSMCLWFAPKDYFPRTDQERLATLEDIERYGDREAFKRSRELRDWLLQASKRL